MNQSERVAWIIATVEFVAIGILIVVYAQADGRARGLEALAIRCDALCLLSRVNNAPCGTLP